LNNSLQGGLAILFSMRAESLYGLVARLSVTFIAMPAVYDRLARFYDPLFYPLERLGLSRLRRETISRLPKTGSILEIGCGSGANFEFYPKWRLAASTDISFEMLKLAMRKRRDNAFVNCNAEELPFAPASFDAAFSTLVFCSIPNPLAAFRELRRVVKPGGTIVLLEHVRPPGKLGNIFDWISFATVKLIEDHFNRKTAETAFEAGLEVIEVRSKLAGIVNLIICRNPTCPVT